MPNIAVIQEANSSGGAGASVSLAFSGPVTPGSSLWLVCRAITATSFTGVSDSVNGAWTQVGSTLNDGGGGHIGAQFKLDNTAAGTPNVTLSMTPNGASVSIGIREIGPSSGYDTQVSVVQSGISSNAPDAVTTGPASPSVQPGLVCAASTQVGGTANTLSAGSSFTGGAALWGGGGNLWEALRYNSLSAKAGTFTQANATGANYFNFAAFFKETGAGASTSNNGAQELQGVGS